MAGDLQLDRGRLTDVAELRAELGSPASGYALMDEAAARWPTEFTWPFVKARMALAAVEVLKAALLNVPAPRVDVTVRTTRYRRGHNGRGDRSPDPQRPRGGHNA